MNRPGFDLFGEQQPEPAALAQPQPAAQARATTSKRRAERPQAAASEVSWPTDDWMQRIHLGTSSWSFPGWRGLVYADAHTEADLSKHGLAAYAAQPWLRTVSLDRSFYRSLTEAQYAAYAVQVPEHFRFVVKAPALVCDALVRESGRAVQPNPLFLNPQAAWEHALQPAWNGLGPKLGALVFQLSPLPKPMLSDMRPVLDSLHQMLLFLQQQSAKARRHAAENVSNPVLAVEIRDPQWIWGHNQADASGNQGVGPEFAQMLKETGTRYCLGLHAKLPKIEAQLPILRATWPGDLVVRWSLNTKHGAFGYEEAKSSYEPFDRLVDDDLETRAQLAKLARTTAQFGHRAMITINNKAEGSAPRSVLALLQSLMG